MSTSTLHLSRQQLVGELVKRAAHRAPDKEAFVHGEIRYDFKTTAERATHFAGWLQANGISHDDKVGFILKNGLPFVEVFFGIALSGAVGVPINFRLAANELEYIITNSDSKILIIDQEFEPTISKLIERIPKVEKVVVVASSEQTAFISYDSIYEQSVNYTPCQQLVDDDGCMIVYTSGTTGRPKGAVITHKNLFQNGMNVMWETGVGLNFKQLVVAPLFHIAAMSTLVNNCLVEGTSVIHREFDPVSILETIADEQINAAFLVPSMWNFLFQVPNIQEYDLSSMQTCMTGGAICPVEVKKAIMNYFTNAGVYDVFGQTEMSPATTCLHPEDSLRKTDSVGRAMINVEVRVVDDDMNDVPVGEVGEILYRGPTVMKEYYKNPEATAEVFQDGWFHSGDLVRMDEEGFIYVVDRKKDMIISGGENIYPAEIEDILYTHPDILECAVIGTPDKDWGEKVKAYIVRKPGKTLEASDVIQYVSKRIASYKKPKEIEFIDQLPRNAAGKVLKQVLRTKDQSSANVK